MKQGNQLERVNEYNQDEQSYEYRPSDAYMRKELELKKGLLMDEFKQADVNGDSMLTEKELLNFLDVKVTLDHCPFKLYSSSVPLWHTGVENDHCAN